ncbi:MAG: response regulator transcription factor [Verrucomicrobiae bacterium]|nr:response regulator transcription factor [Verrucomicrobiae bacterium]
MNTNDQTPLVWIVEDHDRLRETLREVLELEGVGNIAVFPSCEPALATDAPPDPDAIVLDLALPGISGIEGARRFKERFPACEIIVFTVFDDREKVFGAICAGASGYLLKSDPPERIASAVREVLAGGSPMTPEIARMLVERFSRIPAGSATVAISDREQEVLRLLVDGLAKKEIAARLDLSIHTVDNYVRRLYRKLHVNTLGGAVAKALREGLV